VRLSKELYLRDVTILRSVLSEPMLSRLVELLSPSARPKIRELGSTEFYLQQSTENGRGQTLMVKTGSPTTIRTSTCMLLLNKLDGDLSSHQLKINT
jgi:hypothetical protein